MTRLTLSTRSFFPTLYLCAEEDVRRIDLVKLDLDGTKENAHGLIVASVIGLQEGDELEARGMRWVVDRRATGEVDGWIAVPAVEM